MNRDTLSVVVSFVHPRERHALLVVWHKDVSDHIRQRVKDELVWHMLWSVRFHLPRQVYAPCPCPGDVVTRLHSLAGQWGRVSSENTRLHVHTEDTLQLRLLFSKREHWFPPPTLPRRYGKTL